MNRMRIATLNTKKGCNLNPATTAAAAPAAAPVPTAAAPAAAPVPAARAWQMGELLALAKTEKIPIFGVGQTHWMGEGVFGVRIDQSNDPADSSKEKSQVKEKGKSDPDDIKKGKTICADEKKSPTSKNPPKGRNRAKSGDPKTEISKIEVKQEDQDKSVQKSCAGVTEESPKGNCDYFVIHGGDSDTAYRGVAIIVAKDMQHCITGWDIVSNRIVSVDLNLERKEEDASKASMTPDPENKQGRTSKKIASVGQNLQKIQNKMLNVPVTVVQVFSPRSDNVLSEHEQFWSKLKYFVESMLQEANRTILIMGDFLKYGCKFTEFNVPSPSDEEKFDSSTLEKFMKELLPALAENQIKVFSHQNSPFNYFICVRFDEANLQDFSKAAPLPGKPSVNRSLDANINGFQIPQNSTPQTNHTIVARMTIAFEYALDLNSAKIDLPPTTEADNQPTSLHSSVYDNRGIYFTDMTEVVPYIQNLLENKFGEKFKINVPERFNASGWNQVEHYLLNAVPVAITLKNLDMSDRQGLSQIRSLLTRVVTPELRFPKQCATPDDLLLDFPPSGAQLNEVFGFLLRLLSNLCRCTECSCTYASQCTTRKCHCRSTKTSRKSKPCECDSRKKLELSKSDGPKDLKTTTITVESGPESIGTVNKEILEILKLEHSKETTKQFASILLEIIDGSTVDVAVQWGGVIVGSLTCAYPKASAANLVLLWWLLKGDVEWRNCCVKVRGNELVFFDPENRKNTLDGLIKKLKTDLASLNI